MKTYYELKKTKYFNWVTNKVNKKLYTMVIQGFKEKDQIKKAEVITCYYFFIIV